MPMVLSEFAYMRKATTKVDVFSFGIIVMEFLTKRRPTQITEEDGLPISLSQVIEKALGNGIDGLLQVVDPMIHAPKDQERVAELFKLSLSCTNPNPDNRPNMNEVLSSLKKLS